MTDYMNTLLLNDDELKVLNDIVRQSKVTASAEELLLIKLGRSSSPLLDVVFKVGVQWENRMNEINTAANAEPAEEVSEEVDPPAPKPRKKN